MTGGRWCAPRCVGRGGVAEVGEACDFPLSGTAAITGLHAAISADAELSAIPCRACVAAPLTPHIGPVYDSGELPGSWASSARDLCVPSARSDGVERLVVRERGAVLTSTSTVGSSTARLDGSSPHVD